MVTCDLKVIIVKAFILDIFDTIYDFFFNSLSMYLYSVMSLCMVTLLVAESTIPSLDSYCLPTLFWLHCKQIHQLLFCCISQTVFAQEKFASSRILEFAKPIKKNI